MNGRKIFFGLIIVALLLVLIPSTYRMAGWVWLRMPGQVAMDLLLDGQDLSIEGFERIRTSREDALAFDWNGQDAIELGLSNVFQTLLRDDLDEETTQSLRIASVEHLKAGLAAIPISYNGWHALALAQYLLDRPEASAQAFDAALQLTPFAGHNLTSRLQLGVALWGDLSDASKSQLEREIVFATRFRPLELVELAMRNNLDREIRSLIGRSPDRTQLLERYGRAQLSLIRRATNQGQGS